MTFVKTAVRTAACLFVALPLVPAVAQPVTSAPIAAPSAWTVTPDEARGTVEISATAKGGAAYFNGGCSKDVSGGLVGAFSNYHGGGLRMDGQVENVALYVRGADWQEAFSLRLRYLAASGAWEFARPLPPVFLTSFSRGATLAVVNGKNQEVFSFDLTGSTAATRTARKVCGIPVVTY